ncbi:MAG TPA: fibronectin type III domain-containing protein, partial [Coriobacteriia bacterium]
GSYQSSNANAPLLRLQAVDSGFVRWLLPSSWSATSFTAKIDGVPTGYYYAFIISNGVPSFAKLVEITSGATPQLGTYDNATATHATLYVATPSSPPVFNGTATATATISSGYTGTLTFDGTTGNITFTNPGPIGSYTVTVTLTNTCGASLQRTFTLNVVQIGAPANLVATAASESSVQLSWTPVNDAVSYRVFRKSGGGGYVQLPDSPTVPFATDTGLAAGTTYIYYVAAVDAGGGSSAGSNRDLASTIFFTDPVLTPGTTPVRAIHLSEARNAVNAVRIAAGLAPVTFTDAASPGVTVRALHTIELRNALDEARAAIPVPAITVPLPFEGAIIYAFYLQAVRDGVK